MSRMVPLKPPPDLPPRNDPFRYGWRHVLRRIDANGQEVWDQIPLTLDGVLHPEEGDFIVNSSAHAADCTYLLNVLKAWRKHWRRKTVVLMDTRVAWGANGPRPHSPDIAVIPGARNPDRLIRAFDVVAEKVRPCLIIEVTSKTTRYNDLVTKVAQYHQARVPQYVIVDASEPDDGPRTLCLIDYHYNPERYVEQPADERGRVELLGLGLLLGARDGRVVLYDAKTGEEQGDYDQIARALEAESAARAEAEKAIEEAVEARHEAERGRRAAEERANDLAARLRELEARLGHPSPQRPRQP